MYPLTLCLLTCLNSIYLSVLTHQRTENKTIFSVGPTWREGGALGGCWKRTQRLTRMASFRLYCKNKSQVTFIRHGESTVNAQQRRYQKEGDALPGRAYFEPAFFDAPLTDAGRADAIGARSGLQACLAAGEEARSPAVVCVVVSTLRRALETATHAALPILPPGPRTDWIALDSVREATACEVFTCGTSVTPRDIQCEKPCNQRGALDAGVLADFSHVDFTQCAINDPLDPLETISQVDARVAAFMAWLARWAEEQARTHGEGALLHVVVVSHFVFLHRLLSRFDNGGGYSAKTPAMANGEVRTLPLGAILDLVV